MIDMTYGDLDLSHEPIGGSRDWRFPNGQFLCFVDSIAARRLVIGAARPVRDAAGGLRLQAATIRSSVTSRRML